MAIRTVGVTSDVTIPLEADSQPLSRKPPTLPQPPSSGRCRCWNSPCWVMVQNDPNAIAQLLITGMTGSVRRGQLQEAEWLFAKRMF